MKHHRLLVADNRLSASLTVRTERQLTGARSCQALDARSRHRPIASEHARSISTGLALQALPLDNTQQQSMAFLSDSSAAEKSPAAACNCPVYNQFCGSHTACSEY